MKATVLLDYEFAVAQSGYVVRALLKLEGRAERGGESADEPLPSTRPLRLDGGEKLAAAIEAPSLLVRRVRPEDVVSVVAYDDEVTTVVPSGIKGDN
jgi:hypothetical protein